ncbi:MAG: translation initiation factor IF-2 [Nitrososphaeria archaeon]|nr:translation initiation factor IF-2 [Nitrosopumilaceae archaeon]NIP09262.1 translation initiation factor IF-2 [Nitrosopumilaceae archaeon]NIP91136.1 translation initiation factor IF-2 [Nitrososphaeria archaeon]NIS94430.1 translation initiation factor IF-2 [Nitrosopumilaceae archaeon]
MQIRQPIVAVLGHVDSGKTSLLDRIRGTGVQGREAGGITQHIGASFLPTETIKETCGPLYKKLEDSETKIPGLLVIDTPGHEVFTNLRARGGSAADIAILVVDVNRGFQPQTNESLKILQSRKVPFVVALNKCDQLSGWRKSETQFISQAIKEQDQSIQNDLDQKIYDVVGTLSILGYQSEAFYRVKDFKSEVAIVPISARSGVGIPELLAVLIGLTQQYLQKRLNQEEKDPRGIVLEVNDEVGLGQSANIILIDGSIKKTDSIVVAKRDSVIVTKPKAILLPKPLDEMRDPRDKFKPVDQVEAAAGLKIASPDLEDVLPGSTLYVASTDEDIKKYTNLIESEMKSVFVDTETNGIILKCDTIGSLEAIMEMLRRSQVPVAKADIGPVNRRDIMESKAIKENDRHLGVILAFNVKILPDAKEESDNNHIRIFEDKVIYSLIDNYNAWVEEDTAHEEDAIFAEFTPITKFTFLKGYAFRNNNPAVFGIRVDVGELRHKIPFMNKTGKNIGRVHQLQHEGKTVSLAKAGQEVACSVQDVTIGRQIFEEDVFYSFPPSHEAKQLLGKFGHKLSPEQTEILNEIVEIQRKIDPAYAY